VQKTIPSKVLKLAAILSIFSLAINTYTLENIKTVPQEEVQKAVEEVKINLQAVELPQISTDDIFTFKTVEYFSQNPTVWSKVPGHLRPYWADTCFTNNSNYEAKYCFYGNYRIWSFAGGKRYKTKYTSNFYNLIITQMMEKK
jgi:hypothetical protein